VRKRLHKKIEKAIGDIDKMTQRLETAYSAVMTICQALQSAINGIQSYLTRFPMKVEDWATNPPIHSGEYILWFIREGKEPQSRKYILAKGKWHDAKGNEIDVKQYKPSMWMLLPTFDPGVIDMYRRRDKAVE